MGCRVGEGSPARFSCTGEEDYVPEIVEVTHTERNPLQDLCFIVAAFYKAI